MPSVSESLSREQCAMVGRYGKSDDWRGLAQIVTTFAPLALLWWAAVRLAAISPGLAILPLPFIILLLVRAFGLMHECGHGSLFRSRSLNRAFGFLLGVVSGMPQYVWSQHHNYHHAHNGDWEKYRGPYATLSVDEYAALTPARQRAYRCKCSVLAAPLAGFIYLIFTPRYTWLKGSIDLAIHTLKRKLSEPGTSLRVHAASHHSRFWKSSREYRSMLWNNVALLSAWVAMSAMCGTARFFAIYLVTLSIAGGAGIVLFTVQHNFKHSYASDSSHWNIDTGTIKGTTYLVLPRWLNWCTVNIGYHHVHHLSASIPNYHLAECHKEYEHLFSPVTRLHLHEVLGALKYILWDRDAQRIISVDEYLQRTRAPRVAPDRAEALL